MGKEYIQIECSLYIGCLRHLYNEVKKRYNDYDRNIILVPNSPFENLEIPKQEATRKRAISAEAIKEIWELPYQYNNNGTEKKCPYNLAKDCFIISFCLMGMNSIDLYSCSTLEGEVITYYRSKTKDRRLDKAKMKVIVPPILQSLMEKYQDQTKKQNIQFLSHLFNCWQLQQGYQYWFKGSRKNAQYR